MQILKKVQCWGSKCSYENISSIDLKSFIRIWETKMCNKLRIPLVSINVKVIFHIVFHSIVATQIFFFFSKFSIWYSSAWIMTPTQRKWSWYGITWFGELCLELNDNCHYFLFIWETHTPQIPAAGWLLKSLQHPRMPKLTAGNSRPSTRMVGTLLRGSSLLLPRVCIGRKFESGRDSQESNPNTNLLLLNAGTTVSKQFDLACLLNVCVLQVFV